MHLHPHCVVYATFANVKPAENMILKFFGNIFHHYLPPVSIRRRPENLHASTFPQGGELSNQQIRRSSFPFAFSHAFLVTRLARYAESVAYRLAFSFPGKRLT